MRVGKISLLILCLSIGLFSCKNDDDGDIPPAQADPPRDRTEVQDEDDPEIVKYLKSHYYNSDAFGSSNMDPNSSQLVISSVADGNTKLWDDIETLDVTFAETNYIIYYLDLNKNVSAEADSPTFADNVRILYEGFTLENKTFDSAVTPVNSDLTTFIPGWRKVLPLFKTSDSDVIENSDGTLTFPNHGVGVMFLPSGLAYFDRSQTGISAYEPIAFKFDLLLTTENDHDNDGVPSYLEDVDGDGELNDNTDNDFDNRTLIQIPNYIDADDDGDGVLTINEDINNDGDPTNDIGKNGIPNYLDPEETASK